MRSSRPVIAAATAAAALLLGSATACSSSDDEPGEDAGSSEASASSSSTTAPSTTTSSVQTTTTAALAELPEEGRDLASCADGRCRVVVMPGDRITVPASLGGTAIVIASIEPGSVTIQQEGTGNPAGATTITLHDVASGSGLVADDGGYSLAFVTIEDGRAVMQVDA